MWAGPTSVARSFSAQKIKKPVQHRRPALYPLPIHIHFLPPNLPFGWKETSFPPSGILPLPPQRQALHIESHEPIVLTIVFPYGDLRFPDMCRLSFWACVKWDL
ncbi:hypothetical protein CBS63078_4540 [Aspergillus niger]|nr:hypothetical protein CBS133816_2917 [Aspergillus niger]KAI2840787.1 hypothetical protein CBS11350_6806 [Aspergillus niger]KAI2844005.1 hypothetical protein CBS12448_10010 [Aspergillus niger]KAI2887527.1 hypothetical protein CBS13152_6708 [Aspergillus niger]KAI2893966.1 hypothetical protein CBS11852_5147 [Aspergillus niger]